MKRIRAVLMTVLLPVAIYFAYVGWAFFNNQGGNLTWKAIYQLYINNLAVSALFAIIAALAITGETK